MDTCKSVRTVVRYGVVKVLVLCGLEPLGLAPGFGLSALPLGTPIVYPKILGLSTPFQKVFPDFLGFYVLYILFNWSLCDMYTLYTPQEIAENIKNLAKAQHIVVKDMLDILDIGKNSIYTMRAGSYPRIDTLAKIAAYLHTSSMRSYTAVPSRSRPETISSPRSSAQVHTTKSAQAYAPVQAQAYACVCACMRFIL